jgi:hypothetical protein
MSLAMLSAYRTILSTPGAPAFTAAGALGTGREDAGDTKHQCPGHVP